MRPQASPALPAPPVLDVRDLDVVYALAGGQQMRAVERLSFAIGRGQTLALVGESGCGKSSVAKAVMQLVPTAGGVIRLEGQALGPLGGDALKRLRRRFQMIFQDPISSLNPQRTVRQILEFPLKVNGLFDKSESERRIRATLDIVGLDSQQMLGRYPHEFSGGQCQRISIARALILDPVLLVCDEPVSALDVSVRAQVLNLLGELRQRLGLSMLFISHDLAVVRNVADCIAVMYLGRICEAGDAQHLLEHPAHPYTVALLSAVLHADPAVPPRRVALQGEMPSPLSLPTGCRFRTRCPGAQALCAAAEPALTALADGRQVACHFPYSVARPAANTSASAFFQPEDIAP
ncbi:ATP-binding cassette domain-containing protein [Verminephrobacter eiseniae]|uniref:ABC transporter ATP-binding protein n=1 Tax=Verminephrobacter eiseniae TaxID=364317 RepID=UPI00223747B7|nr:oligopeptide/dipeptide ABC transporter ATP-binding protein [Verminephrobacter eiseniae]MCW5261114.1 ATP-binding cassette domain-containing protein [Verminephrobacter eiseniae]